MRFVPVNEPDLKGNEKKYLNECIESGWISWEGPFVKNSRGIWQILLIENMLYLFVMALPH